MKTISKERLVKGYTYYIECTSISNNIVNSRHSGKKIGIFDSLVYPCGENPAFAQFIQLTDLPNATIPNQGMGSNSMNYYSTLNHKFILVTKKNIKYF
jgi:hypothetical protein